MQRFLIPLRQWSKSAGIATDNPRHELLVCSVSVFLCQDTRLLRLLHESGTRKVQWQGSYISATLNDAMCYYAGMGVLLLLSDTADVSGQDHPTTFREFLSIRTPFRGMLCPPLGGRCAVHEAPPYRGWRRKEVPA